MVEDTLEGRYAPVQSILEEQLTKWFGEGSFKIIHPPDDYAKWKVDVPQRLEYHQKVELNRLFREYRQKPVPATATRAPP